jgi:hypothetical protein
VKILTKPYGSGNVGSELTENIRQFEENKFYGTLKHQDNQGGITNAFWTHLPEKSGLKFQALLTICKEIFLPCQKINNGDGLG